MIRLCKKCGCETERYKSGDCKPCGRRMVAEYRAANPEIVKARYDAWIAKNAARVKAKAAVYKEAHKEKIKARNAADYLANREKIKSRTKAWQEANREKSNAQKAAWKSANPDKVKVGNAAYLQANLDKHRINQQKRRSRKADVGGSLSINLAEKLFKLQNGKCTCGCKQNLGDNYHLDHIVPLALGGTNTDDNIQLLRSKCNLSKGAKHPIDFMQKNGFLL